VTEFTTTDKTTNKSKYERRIFAHCVVDATAKHQEMDSVLLVHAPGFCSWHAHDPAGNFRQSVAPIEDSMSYYPKARREQDFDKFEATNSP
jgi:hypothetical protein